MSSMADRYQRNLEEAVKPLIDGPLVLATIGSPVGSMSNLFRAEAFNVATSGIGDGSVLVSGSTRGRVRQSGGKDIHLPRSFAVALTATSVVLLQVEAVLGQVKIKKELARMPRDGLNVRIGPGKASATVFILVSETTGTRTAFEMATLGMSAAKAKVEQVTAAFAPRHAVEARRAGVPGVQLNGPVDSARLGQSAARPGSYAPAVYPPPGARGSRRIRCA